MKRMQGFVAAAAVAFAATAAAQTKWDMPTPYPATNFHTENIVQFAADVEKATGGKLKITVHPGASLFKAPEIKRAVQGGQAQIGEILISGYSNEDPIFGVDSVPFLATELRRRRASSGRSRARRSRSASRSRAWSCSTPCRGRRRASTPPSRSIRSRT